MSNNFTGVETRNKRRVKASPEPIGKGVPDQNGDDSERDIYNQQQTKKLKTENNSLSKNILLTSNNVHAKGSLQLLKDFAADNDEYNNSQETIDALQLILEYKYRSRKVVFTKDLFQRKIKNNVNPSIFTKKNLQIRLNRPQNAMQLAFENYLNLVAQLYYKATHTLTDVYSIVESSQFSLNGEEKPVIQLKRGRKPGRKPKAKNQPKVAVENPGTPEGSLDDAVEEEEEKQAKEQEPTKVEVENLNGMLVECIDQLVSPLKVDYTFGNFVRKGLWDTYYIG